MIVVLSYLNLLAYFYEALYTAFPANIIIDRYQFKSRTAYNTYIEQLPRGKEAFLAELQGLDFILEAFRIIAKVETNFAKEVIERDN